MKEYTNEQLLAIRAKADYIIHGHLSLSEEILHAEVIWSMVDKELKRRKVEEV